MHQPDWNFAVSSLKDEKWQNYPLKCGTNYQAGYSDEDFRREVKYEKPN